MFFLHYLRKKNESQRKRLAVILSLFLFIGIFFLWVIQFQKNLDNRQKQNTVLEGKKALSEIEGIWFNISEGLSNLKASFEKGE